MTATRKTTTAFATVVALLVVAVAYLVARQPVDATHTPADKAYAAGDALTPIPAGTGTTILSATMRTSKPTDLMFHVTLECAILTKLLTQTATTDLPNANAASTVASIRVWIEQTVGTTTRMVPISSSSEPPQNGSSDDEGDKVTFCHREEGRQVTDAEDEGGQIDTMQTYQDTKTANAFNWVLLNAGSGVYTYNVKADLVEEGGDSCTKDFVAETCSNAFIGNRTLLIVPTKMANNISV